MADKLPIKPRKSTKNAKVAEPVAVADLAEPEEGQGV